jgi:hypothetical protein
VASLASSFTFIDVYLHIFSNLSLINRSCESTETVEI